MTAPLSSNVNHFNGKCPSCGEETLRTVRGDIYCGNEKCADTEALVGFLKEYQPHHIVLLDDHHWNMQHPMLERLKGNLHHCPAGKYIAKSGVHPNFPNGFYILSRGDESTDEWLWAPMKKENVDE